MRESQPAPDPRLLAGLQAAYGGDAPSVLTSIDERIGGPPSKVLLWEEDSAREASPVVDPRTAFERTLPSRRGSYQVLGEIARGGMGVVLKGHDVDLGRDVAMKVLHGELAEQPAALQRFLEEAQIGGQLQHPGIVPVYELGLMSDERPYFTMKLVKGRTLGSLLSDRANPIDDQRRFLGIFEQVCQTIAYAHARGVIHRDLKPANVLVGAFGEVQVVDWGLSKVLPRGGVADEEKAKRSRVSVIETIRTQPGSSGSKSRAGSVMGTPAYMPPEQAQGLVDQLDERSDVFSLGAILCEILTGAPPYPGEKEQTLVQAAHAELEPATERLERSGADPGLVELAKRCLAPAQATRPRTAEVLARGIGDHLSSVEERARAAQIAAAEARGKAAEERKARRITVGLSGLVVAAILVGGGGWLQLQRERDERVSETEKGVGAALAEAAVHQGAGAWTEAEAAVDRARALLAAGVTLPEMRAKLDELTGAIASGAETARRRAELEAENRELLARLEQIRSPEISHPNYPIDWREVAREHEEAFAEHGLDIQGMPPEEAGAVLRERGIPVELAAAIDKWTTAVQYFATEDEPILHLHRVTRTADPDPTRTKLRQAMLAADLDGMRALAGAEQLATYPPTTLGLLGFALADMGAVEEAVAVYREARRLHPGDWLINFGLGVWLLHTDPPQLEESVRFLTVAAALRPENIQVRHALASTLESKLGRRAEALEMWRALLEERSEDGHLHWHLGYTLSNLGDLEASLEAHGEAVRLDPESAAAWSGLGFSYLNLGRLGESIAPLEESIRLDPDNFQNHVALGAAYLQTGDLEGARAENAEAIRIDPDHFMPHNNQGNLLRMQGDHEGAVAAYREALRHVTEEYRYTLLHNLAGSLYEAGEYEEAIVRYREVLELVPDYAPSLNGLAWSLAFSPEEGLRDAEEAIELARRAVELEPENALHWNTLGMAYYSAARWRDGLEAIERSQELKGEDQADAGHDLLIGAMAYWQLGDGEQAREWFDRAVAWMEAGERVASETRRERRGVVGTVMRPPIEEDEDLQRLHAQAAKLLGIETDD